MPEPSPLARRLGIELQAMRSMAGLSQAAMAARLGKSQKTVSRIETGERLPDRAELAAWLEGADDDMRSRIRVMNDSAHVEARAYAGLRKDGHLQGVAAEDEELATRVRCYTSGFVPGLLETDEYALRLLPLVDREGDPAAGAAARMQRQRRLYEGHRRFEFLIAEAVLVWAPAAHVMRAQLERLVSASSLANVEIRVLPSQRVGAPAWHDFIMWDAPDRPSWVTVEMAHAAACTADQDLVRGIYVPLWDSLWAAAVHGDEALELIRGT